MDPLSLRANCGQCIALCCVSLAFDRSELFGFSKAAATPCRNLTRDDRCSIHDDLEPRGFAGCVQYDCLGAGQRVVQELYPGRSWREGPALAHAMFDAFRAMRAVHELLLLLETAARLPLTGEQSGRRQQLTALLEPELGWTPETLAAFEHGSTPRAVRDFLESLRGVAGSLRARSRLPVLG